MPHWFRLEGNRQRAPVNPVMVKIHQHQAAREQLIQHRPPTLLAGEHLVLVEQHQLIRFGSDQGDIPAAECTCLVDAAICFNHALGKGMRISQHFESVADNRPAAFAGNVI